jgi:bifunctional non-homologous end joining protein LigD
MMVLERYQAKRRFDQTPEPDGGHSEGKELRFVIQKHEASHLHYDFRLEIGGVLRSWAIPKGPSLDPSIKRLAMAVEDHPYDYRTFEGNIPEGNYGAGSVMVWDEGTYTVASGLSKIEAEALIKRGLDAGKLTFSLHGHKVQGEFMLIKTQQQASSWLLRKNQDEFVSKEDVLQQDCSVLSHRSMEEIRHNGSRRKAKPFASKTSTTVKSSAKTKKPKAREATSTGEFPHPVKPMLATLIDKPFNQAGWLFEFKWDGYRAIAEINAGSVNLYSRNGLSFNPKYPAIVQELERIQGHHLVLDGEIVALDQQGTPSFQGLQDFAQRSGELIYYVFDLLYLDGEDLRALPLLQRKERLKAVLPPSTVVRYCEHVEQVGERLFELATQSGQEGIIAKDASSPYETGKRSPAWLKIKSHYQQETIICGYTEPQGKRQEFGALILGAYDDQHVLRYLGHSGTGFNTQELKKLKRQFKQYASQECPFPKVPATNQKQTWLRPELVCEIKFTGWTDDHQMRHPVYQGLRVDKRADEVVIENKMSLKTALAKEARKQEGQEVAAQGASSTTGQFSREVPKAGTGIVKVNGQRVTITHPQKVLWPELAYTKLDLVEYYEAIGPYILPYLKDRPFVMNRFPNGINEAHFFQKDRAGNAPKWMETISIASESSSRDIEYVLCQNIDTLLYLANQGCIETHVWNSRVQKLDNPDWLIIDLDPEGVGFESVIETALLTHEVLEEIGAANYCKTSGASGIHIYIPLQAKYEFETVKNFAQLIALIVNQRAPNITSLERSPSKRRNRVYLDYLQNNFAQTVVSPFSVRPTLGATVSMPLAWEQVKPGLQPTDFTIKNVPKQAKSASALWQPVLTTAVSLPNCLKGLEKLWSKTGSAG